MDLAEHLALSNIKRSSGFDDAFREFASEDKNWANLHIKDYRLPKDEMLTYRVINHWTGIGLLDDDRESARSWRQFDAIDCVWISIISNLRKFGFPNENIGQVKKTLIDLVQGGRYCPLLDYYIKLALIDHIPVFLLVYDNGFCDIGTETEANASDSKFPSHHIRLSLNTILSRVMPKEDLTPETGSAIVLSPEEVEVLSAIRAKNFVVVTVKTANGRVRSYSATEQVNANKRVKDLMSTGKYQDIEVKQQDGKVVSISRTLKKKFS